MKHYTEETENTETENSSTTTSSGTTNAETSNPESVAPVVSDDNSGEIPKPGGKKEENPKKAIRVA